MFLKIPKVRKLVSGCLVVCFAVFSTVSGAPSLSFAESVPAAKTFVIPAELGKIAESFQGSSDKSVIYISDAHDSLEAQENISQIIQNLVKEEGIRTVFEEGYEGRVPTDELFGFIKDSEIKEKVSYFLLDRLRIGAAEYAHINRTQDFRLIGADNIALHLKNIAAYADTDKTRAKTAQDLDLLLKPTRALADRFFSSDLKTILKLRERFDRKEIQLLDYLKRLQELSPPDANEFQKDFPNLALLLGFSQRKDGTVLEKIKNLDAKNIFSELERYERKETARFLKEERDARIFDFLRTLELLKRLNANEVTASEYEVVKARLQSFKTQDLVNFISETSRKSLVVSKSWEQSIQNAVSFYETAHARDAAIAKSLDDFLRDKKEITAILVYGGFHSDAIKRILKEKNISYSVVLPRITKRDPRHQGYYRELMSRGFYPYEVKAGLVQAAKPESIFELSSKMGNRISAYLANLADFTAKADPKTPSFSLNRELEQVSALAKAASLGMGPTGSLEGMARDWIDPSSQLKEIKNYDDLIGVAWPKSVRGLKILELGFGYDLKNMRKVANRGAQVTALTIDPREIESAKSAFGNQAGKIRWVVGDFKKPLTQFRDDEFDGIMFKNILDMLGEPTPDKYSRFFSELYRLLKPGGKIIISEIAPGFGASVSSTFKDERLRNFLQERERVLDIRKLTQAVGFELYYHDLLDEAGLLVLRKPSRFAEGRSLGTEIDLKEVLADTKQEIYGKLNWDWAKPVFLSAPWLSARVRQITSFMRGHSNVHFYVNTLEEVKPVDEKSYAWIIDKHEAYPAVQAFIDLYYSLRFPIKTKREYRVLITPQGTFGRPHYDPEKQAIEMNPLLPASKGIISKQQGEMLKAAIEEANRWQVSGSSLGTLQAFDESVKPFVDQLKAELKTADVVVTIPFFNEVFEISPKAVGTHGQKVDVRNLIDQAKATLDWLLPQGKKALILAVGETNSPTAKETLSAVGQYIQDKETKQIKIRNYGKDEKFAGPQGKKWSMRLGMQMAQRLKADFVSVDGDMDISNEWLSDILLPIQSTKFDYVSPNYVRYYGKDDIAMISHFVYPVFSAVYGQRVRMPNGGEFAASPRVVELLLKDGSVWEKEIPFEAQFAAVAIGNNKKATDVWLGEKRHKMNPLDPNAKGFDDYFNTAVGGLFDQMSAHPEWWIGKADNADIEVIGATGPPADIARRSARSIISDQIKISEWIRAYRQGFTEHRAIYQSSPYLDIYPILSRLYDAGDANFDLASKEWAKIVFVFLKQYLRTQDPEKKKLIIALLKPILIARIASFASEVERLTFGEAEELLTKQARDFAREKVRVFEWESWWYSAKAKYGLSEASRDFMEKEYRGARDNMVRLGIVGNLPRVTEAFLCLSRPWLLWDGSDPKKLGLSEDEFTDRLSDAHRSFGALFAGQESHGKKVKDTYEFRSRLKTSKDPAVYLEKILAFVKTEAESLSTIEGLKGYPVEIVYSFLETHQEAFRRLLEYAESGDRDPEDFWNRIHEAVRRADKKTQKALEENLITQAQALEKHEEFLNLELKNPELWETSASSLGEADVSALAGWKNGIRERAGQQAQDGKTAAPSTDTAKAEALRVLKLTGKPETIHGASLGEAGKPKREYLDAKSSSFDIQRWFREAYVPLSMFISESFQAGALDFETTEKLYYAFIRPLKPDFSIEGLLPKDRPLEIYDLAEVAAAINNQVFLPRGLVVLVSVARMGQVGVGEVVSKEAVETPMGRQIDLYIVKPLTADEAFGEGSADVDHVMLPTGSTDKEKQIIVRSARENYQRFQNNLNGLWQLKDRDYTAFLFLWIQMHYFGPLTSVDADRAMRQEVLGEELSHSDALFYAEALLGRHENLARPGERERISRMILRDRSSLVASLNNLSDPAQRETRSFAIFEIEAKLNALRRSPFPANTFLEPFVGSVLFTPAQIREQGEGDGYIEAYRWIAGALSQELLRRSSLKLSDWQRYLNQELKDMPAFNRKLVDAANKVYEAHFLSLDERSARIQAARATPPGTQISGKSLGEAEKVKSAESEALRTLKVTGKLGAVQSAKTQTQFNAAMDNLKQETLFFVDAGTLTRDLTRGDGSQEEEIWSLVAMNPGKVKLVIYNADPADEKLKGYRALSNVTILSGTPLETYEKLAGSFKRDIVIHLSKEGTNPIEDFKMNPEAMKRLRFFRYDKDEIGVATIGLYYSEVDGQIREEGLREEGGYFKLTLASLLETLAKNYLTTLAIARAA